MAVKYAQGKVYGISNDVNDKLYIGITGQKLNERWYAHKSSKVKKASKLYLAMQEIGIEHFKLFLIEDCPSQSMQELMEREKYYIQHYDCVANGYNTNVSARTKEERKQQKSQTDKAYREAQGKAYADRKKEYYENNKERCKENSKKSQERNKEARKEYMKAYADKNKEKLRERHRQYYLKTTSQI
jgi:group I intron endonuclease